MVPRFQCWVGESLPLDAITKNCLKPHRIDPLVSDEDGFAGGCLPAILSRDHRSIPDRTKKAPLFPRSLGEASPVWAGMKFPTIHSELLKKNVPRRMIAGDERGQVGEEKN